MKFSGGILLRSIVFCLSLYILPEFHFVACSVSAVLEQGDYKLRYSACTIEAFQGG